MKNFWATEAALIFVTLAYNLMSIFRMFVLQEKTQRKLSTLRFRVFALPGVFPSGLQEGWQQATYLNCNLVMAELSPDDGVVV